MIEDLEQALCDRLSANPGLSDQARIGPWPDRPQDYGRPGLSGMIFVRFAGLVFESPEMAGRRGAPQAGTIRFEFRLLLAGLRSHSGAYAALAAIQREITEFKPALGDGYSLRIPGFYLRSCELVERSPESGQWDWGALYEAGIIYEH